MGSGLFITLPIFVALPLSLVVVSICAYLSVRIALRLELIDNPGSEPHKKHLRPTPLAGGLALISTMLLCAWFLGMFSDTAIKAILLAAMPIFLVGLWDDFKSISPPIKLAGQILSAVLLIRMGVLVQIFESPEFFLHINSAVDIYLDWLVTIFWIVGITNAFNFVDSMDGLAVGLSGVAAGFFTLVMLETQQTTLALYSALIVGACVGLYFFNSPPAMLFLGDSGAQTLGFLLAALAIVYSPQNANQSSSWLVPILLLGVPIFDMGLVVLCRLRKRRPVYVGALDHTYHRLLRLGLEPGRAVMLMHMVAFILSCLAFVILKQPPIIANSAFALVLLVGAWAMAFLEKQC